MPKVPTLDRRVATRASTTQRVDSTAGVNAFRSAAQGAAEVQQAAGGLVETGMKFALEERKKADDASFKEGMAEITKLETDVLHNRQYGALNKRGKDALATYDSAMQSFDDGVTKIKDNYNDRVKERLELARIDSKASMDRTLQKHMAVEGARYDEEVKNNVLASEQDAAELNYADEDRVNGALDRQIGTLANMRDNYGWSKERFENEMNEAVGQTQTRVINKIVDGGGYKEANDYYQKVKDSLSGEYQTQIEKTLKKSTLRGESQETTDELMEKHSDLGAALEDARQIEDPEKRDEVVRRVKQRFNERKAVEQLSKENLYEEMNDTLVSNNGNIDAIPASQLASLNAREERDLRAYAQKLRSGDNTARNSDKYLELTEMAATPATRDKFMRLNLRDPKYRASMHPSDFNELHDAQMKLRKGDSDTIKLLDGIESKNAIVTNQLKEIGIGNKEEADIKKSNLFKRKVEELIVQKQQTLGRKVNNAEVREIVNSLAVQTSVDREGLFTGDKRIFELTPQEEAEVKFSDVPSKANEDISAALRRNNIPVTQENILQVYTMKLNRLRQKNGI